MPKFTLESIEPQMTEEELRAWLMTPIFERATKMQMRYPLSAWEDEWLSGLECELEAMVPSSEQERADRAWWLDYIHLEQSRRLPNPWQGGPR